MSVVPSCPWRLCASINPSLTGVNPTKSYLTCLRYQAIQVPGLPWVRGPEGGRGCPPCCSGTGSHTPALSCTIFGIYVF